jgi:hypothetical protein
LVKHGIEWRNSKTILGGKSRDPGYELKKRIEELRYNTTPADSVLLYQDEKGPIAAKRHTVVHHMVFDTSQDRKSTKDKMYSKCICGVYDHTNDQMYTHFYKNKTGDQFLDFIKRIDRKYDSSSIKQIFLVLDSASIHRSK